MLPVSKDFAQSQVAHALDILEQFGPFLGYSCCGSTCGKITFPLPLKFPCCDKRMCRWCLWTFINEDPRYSPDLPCCSSDPQKIREWHEQASNYAGCNTTTANEATVTSSSNSIDLSSNDTMNNSNLMKKDDLIVLTSEELEKYLIEHADDLEGRTTKDLQILIQNDKNCLGWKKNNHAALYRALKKACLKTTRDKHVKNVYRIERISKCGRKRDRKKSKNVTVKK